eukprot:7456151-Pyramimonas_sp.AAC.1
MESYKIPPESGSCRIPMEIYRKPMGSNTIPMAPYRIVLKSHRILTESIGIFIGILRGSNKIPIAIMSTYGF